MMYDYTPLSDDEISEIFNFELAPGKIKWKVIEVVDTRSSTGSPMISLKLKCKNIEEPNIGKNGLVNYHLVFNINSQGFVAQFFKSAGKILAYKNKQWDSKSMLHWEGEAIAKEEEYTTVNKQTGNEEERKGIKISTFLSPKDSHSGLNKDAFADMCDNQASKEFFGDKDLFG